MEDKPLIITAIVIAVIGGAVAYFLLNPLAVPAKMPEEEGEEIIPAIEHVAEKSGRMMEVLHDSRIMFYMNSYSITDTIDAPLTEEPVGNKFLTVDLTVMNMGDHILTLSPNLFKLNTSFGELMPSIYTPVVDAGLRNIYLPGGLTIRTFVVFTAQSFGDAPLILKYFDKTSAFSITLLRSESPQDALPSKTEVVNKMGELMHDDSLQLTASATSIKEVGKYTPKSNNMFLKISMSFKNIDESAIRIDPSYVFILDDKSYLYGTHESTINLASPLKTTDLEPGSSISGDVVIELPKDSTNLIFMYAGSNNSFFARIS